MKRAAILFLVGVFLNPQTSVIESYKNGKIIFQPEPGFGVRTDWLSLFYEDVFMGLAVRKSGEIYISHPLQNRILQLGPRGDVKHVFGKAGQGPGDLDFPGCLSILDDRFLVVQERLRISLFDLDGRFDKILVPRLPPRATLALRNGIAAYVADRYGEKKIHKSVRLIDSASGRETELISFQLNHENDRKYITRAFTDDVLIQRTTDGKLLVGHSGSPDVHLFSETGKKEMSFRLRMDPAEISAKLKEEFFQYFFRIIDRSGFSGYGEKTIDMRDRSKYYFPPYVPYFQDLKIDGGGNILVFKYRRYSEKQAFEFQVYSAAGEFVCDSVLDMDDVVLPRNQLDNFCFQGVQILGWSVVRDAAGDFSGLRLLRGSLKSLPPSVRETAAEAQNVMDAVRPLLKTSRVEPSMISSLR